MNEPFLRTAHVQKIEERRKDIMAVSYTHLVKKKIRKIGMLSSIALMICLGVTGCYQDGKVSLEEKKETDSNPVSYTHLDIFVVKILIIVVNLVNIFKVLCRSACVLKCPVIVPVEDDSHI